MKTIGYLVTGIVAGILGGLLGIGGGAIMVPSMNLILGDTMHLAIAASLSAMIFIGAASAYGHWKNGYVLKNVVVWMAPTATLAAIAGVLSASHIPVWILQRIFALFLFYTAFDMVRKLIRARLGNVKDEEPISEFIPKHKWLIPLIAVPMGFSCGVLGIGGGVIAVPSLHFFLRLPLKNAIANSSATILFSATVAAVVKLVAINGMVIDVPGGEAITLAWYHAAITGLIIACTAITGARVGAHLTKISPTALIRFIFAIVALWGAVKYWNKASAASASVRATTLSAKAEPIKSPVEETTPTQTPSSMVE